MPQGPLIYETYSSVALKFKGVFFMVQWLKYYINIIFIID